MIDADGAPTEQAVRFRMESAGQDFCAWTTRGSRAPEFRIDALDAEMRRTRLRAQPKT
jgi:hypothetical protein